MTDYMTGAELQALREACGLDRDQFGALCGVRGRAIKYWETGASNHGVPADVAAMVQELEAKVSAMTEDAIARHSGASALILMRGADPIDNEVASRVYLALRRCGQAVRMVAFDYKAYRAALRGQDTPEARQAWAVRALKEQARPHRQDQPTV
jgi:transcriptional regulator with XRE-family HTH domain